jgi:hypothetical protein
VSGTAVPEEGDEVEQACGELRRLLGLAEAIPAGTLTRVFADPHLRAALSRPSRSGREPAAYFAAESAADGGRRRARALAPGAAATAVAAFWAWARTGFGVVDARTAARRLNACGQCLDYVEAPPTVLHVLAGAAAGEARVCRHCGCFMGKKARQLSARCPAGRWG